MRRLLSRTRPAAPAPAPKADVPAVRSEHGYITPRRLELRERDHSADDQDVKRERRRKWLPVGLDESFTLTNEVQEIMSGVRTALSDDPCPQAWVRQLGEMAQEMSLVVFAIGELIQEKTRWIPEPCPESVVDGSWLDSIVAVAEPLDRPLQAALGRQKMSRNGSSLSDDVVAQLRELDRLAAQMYQRLRSAHVAREARVRKPRSALSVSLDQARLRNAAQLAEVHEQHRAELAELWEMRRGL